MVARITIRDMPDNTCAHAATCPNYKSTPIHARIALAATGTSVRRAISLIPTYFCCIVFGILFAFRISSPIMAQQTIPERVGRVEMQSEDGAKSLERIMHAQEDLSHQVQLQGNQIATMNAQISTISGAGMALVAVFGAVAAWLGLMKRSN